MPETDPSTPPSTLIDPALIAAENERWLPSQAHDQSTTPHLSDDDITTSTGRPINSWAGSRVHGRPNYVPRVGALALEAPNQD